MVCVVRVLAMSMQFANFVAVMNKVFSGIYFMRSACGMVVAVKLDM